MLEDFEHRYRAVRSRDARFDGWFFVAVTSTGTYCRPELPGRHAQAPEEVRDANDPSRSHLRATDASSEHDLYGSGLSGVPTSVSP